MTFSQGAIIVLCIAGLVGLLWLCYITIKINDEEREYERRHGRIWDEEKECCERERDERKREARLLREALETFTKSITDDTYYRGWFLRADLQDVLDMPEKWLTERAALRKEGA